MRKVLRWTGVAVSAFWILSALVPYWYCRVWNLASTVLLIVFVPVGLLLLFGGWTARLLQRIRQSWSGRWLVNVCAALAGIAVIYVVAVSVWMAVVCANQPPGDGDAVCIVMGCQVNGEYEPSPILANRLKKAVEYLEEHPDAVCIVSGCQGPDEAWPEAVVMRNYLVRAGIEESRILLEEQAGNTEENLRYSAELMEKHGLGKQAVVVTDWWHQLRSGIWAEKCGLETYAASAPAPRPVIWVLDPVYYARELLGMARLLVIGR